ncbi:hypothetical protein XarjCFBP7653_17475 [Xanthomonas arboricola]|nr:hypothetical protein XarjCFBP7653_17475 [Xanthomonas arboricola]
MPSWSEVVNDFSSQPEDQRSTWLFDEIIRHMRLISNRRNGRNVLLYASGFLQKVAVPSPYVGVSLEDMNGLMATLHGLDCSKGITLIVHTPGGDVTAADNLMSYLHSKFDEIETIVPAYAMSAGTMMVLGSDRVVMGRQSQLGPIDAQIFTGNRMVSAGAVLTQFESAKNSILNDEKAAALWAPILQSMGPALEQEARYALKFGERMVTGWLAKKMCASDRSPIERAEEIAKYFNTTDEHMLHSRRIDRDQARAQGLIVEDLEDDQDFQDEVLTLYHLTSIFFETSSSTKVWINQGGNAWVKHFNA